MNRFTQPEIKVLNHMYESAQKGDCKEVGNSVGHWVTALGTSHLAPSQMILERLQKGNFDFIAMEQDPSVLDWFQESASRFHDAFDYLREKCSPLKSSLENLELQVVGPDLLATLGDRPKLESLEDSATFKAGQKILMQSEALQSNPSLSRSIRQMVDVLGEKSAKTGNLLISDAEAERITQAESNQKRREVARRYVALVRQLWQNAHDRNLRIASSLSSAGGNHALVIGENHVVDLFQAIDSECHKKQKVGPSLEPSAQPEAVH